MTHSLHTRVLPPMFYTELCTDPHPAVFGWHVERRFQDAVVRCTQHRGPFDTEEQAHTAAWQWALERECKRLRLTKHRVHSAPRTAFSLYEDNTLVLIAVPGGSTKGLPRWLVRDMRHPCGYTITTPVLNQQDVTMFATLALMSIEQSLQNNQTQTKESE